MPTKAITLTLPTEEKAAAAGEVSALFSTMNVVDKDNDVTLPGAFEQGAPVRIASYGHKLSELPVGRGQIQADEFKAVMSGRFFINTTVGKDTYLTVKEMSDLQEWSYEYDVLDFSFGEFDGKQVRFLKRVKVHGVTPVYLGAGVDTQTLDIKSFMNHGEESLAILDEFVVRARERVEFRAKDSTKEGRSLSTATRNRLAGLLESMQSAMNDVAKLLEDTAPKGSDDDEKSQAEIRRAFLEFERTKAHLNGVLSLP